MYFCLLLQVQPALYGIDWNAPLDANDEADAVVVPDTTIPLSQSDYLELCQLIDPTSDCDDHGVGQYLAAVHFTECKVSQY